MTEPNPTIIDGAPTMTEIDLIANPPIIEDLRAYAGNSEGLVGAPAELFRAAADRIETLTADLAAAKASGRRQFADELDALLVERCYPYGDTSLPMWSERESLRDLYGERIVESLDALIDTGRAGVEGAITLSVRDHHSTADTAAGQATARHREGDR
jgi:hypothetical protein